MSYQRGTSQIIYHTELIFAELLHFLPFVQFKKYGKQQWKGITFSKSATLLKVTLLHECFPLFENCTNGIKSRKASQIVQVSNNQEVKGSV